MELKVVVEEGVAHAAADAGRTQTGVPAVVTSAMVTFTFPQKPAESEPFTAPLADVTQSPGVSVKVLAGRVPLFLMLTVDWMTVPGAAVVLPPNLLMVEQVPALAAVTVPAAEDRQVVAPCVSVMRRVPDPTVLLVLLMLAVNPENAGVRANAAKAVAMRPIRTVRNTDLRRGLVWVVDMGCLLSEAFRLVI